MLSWRQFLEHTITCRVVSGFATEVVTWGDAHYGADDHSTVLSDQRSGRNVTAIQANLKAFSAILDDGTAVAWGDPIAGGDSSSLDLRIIETSIQMMVPMVVYIVIIVYFAFSTPD